MWGNHHYGGGWGHHGGWGRGWGGGWGGGWGRGYGGGVPFYNYGYSGCYTDSWSGATVCPRPYGGGYW